MSPVNNLSELWIYSKIEFLLLINYLRIINFMIDFQKLIDIDATALKTDCFCVTMLFAKKTKQSAKSNCDLC